VGIVLPSRAWVFGRPAFLARRPYRTKRSQPPDEPCDAWGILAERPSTVEAPEERTHSAEVCSQALIRRDIGQRRFTFVPQADVPHRLLDHVVDAEEQRGRDRARTAFAVFMRQYLRRKRASSPCPHRCVLSQLAYPGMIALPLGDEAGFITGQTINVSGGLTMHG
jgi:hypothetical protein